MKIIERVEPKFANWPRRYTCAICHSVLEVEAKDVTIPGQWDGRKGWWTCLVCNRNNYLNEEDTREASQFSSLPPSRPITEEKS